MKIYREIVSLLCYFKLLHSILIDAGIKWNHSTIYFKQMRLKIDRESKPLLYPIVNLSNFKKEIIRSGYGNTGCGVFKRGVQNWKYFCLKINIPKGNYWILRIGVMGRCQKLMLSKNVNNKKCAHKLIFFNEKNEKYFDDFWHRKLTLKVKSRHLPITPILKIQ